MRKVRRRSNQDDRSKIKVENCLHWAMDLVVGGDVSRIRLDETPENLAVIRHITINSLKQHLGKQSLKPKRFRVALDGNLLLTRHLMR